MRTVHSSDWCKITNSEDGKSAEIFIEGVIGGDFWESFFGDGDSDKYYLETKEELRAELKSIDALGVENITVRINSLGGDVAHALSMHDLLKNHSAKVTTVAEGMTASAATIILQAGDEREISENALLLIHNVRSFCAGSLNEIEGQVENLKRVNDKLVKVYATRSGNDKESFSDLMNKDNGNGIWIDASEAIDYGLVDKEITSMKVAAIASADRLTSLGLPVYNSKNSKMSDLKEFINSKIDSLKTTFEKRFKNLEDQIEVVEEIEDTIEEPVIVNDEKDDRIAELETQVADKDAKIAELESEIAELKGGEEEAEDEAENAKRLAIQNAASVSPKKKGVNAGVERTEKSKELNILNDVFASISASQRRMHK